MSSVRTQLTYDRSLLFAATEHITGGGFNIAEMIQMQQRQSLGELRWRAHTAFKTARETLKNLERVKNRRKAFIYISAGYDFNPFSNSFGQGFLQQQLRDEEDGDSGQTDTSDIIENRGSVFSETELHTELYQLSRLAARASTTFHTLDPRGLMAGGEAEYMNLDTREYSRHVFRTQSSLRTIAELTGASLSSTGTASRPVYARSTPRQATITCSDSTRIAPNPAKGSPGISVSR